MSAQAIFPLLPWKHDPSGQPYDYTMPLPVPATDTIVTVTVVAVDDADQALVDDTFTIENVSFSVDGSAWKVTFWARNGTPGAIYKVRCRWTLTDGRGSDKTGRLQCLNT
jgi:hypothetical protein